MTTSKNKRVEGFEAYYARLEKAAQRIVREAEDRKEGYLISPIDMVALRAVLKDRPDGNAFAAVCVECDKPIVDGHGVNSASGPRHLGCWKMAANQEKS